MPNIRGKTWTEGDFFTPTDAQFFEDHLYDGGGGGGGASWGAISGNIQNQTDLIDYIDEHSGGSASWGSITGTIENQTDLVEYIATHGGGGGGAAWGSIAGNIQNQTDLVTNFAQKNQLSTVATSGSYNDLSNKPTLSTVASSGSYNDLSNKPNLAAVATSGSYNDLTNKPTLAAVASSGSYNDLIDKPEGGSAAWGEIVGNIESQTDLVNYVSSHGGGLPSGGTTGNMLVKDTSAAGASWKDVQAIYIDDNEGSTPTLSKITTLFSDEAKTDALYPRTKFNAVSDDNGNILGTIAVLNSIDISGSTTTPNVPFYEETGSSEDGKSIKLKAADGTNLYIAGGGGGGGMPDWSSGVVVYTFANNGGQELTCWTADEPCWIYISVLGWNGYRKFKVNGVTVKESSVQTAIVPVSAGNVITCSENGGAITLTKYKLG